MHTLNLSTAALLYLRTVLETAEGYDSVADAISEAFGPDAETDEEIEAMCELSNAASENLWGAIVAAEAQPQEA